MKQYSLVDPSATCAYPRRRHRNIVQPRPNPRLHLIVKAVPPTYTVDSLHTAKYEVQAGHSPGEIRSAEFKVREDSDVDLDQFDINIMT